MFFDSFCSDRCPTHWNQVLSRGWRCSWSSADRRCSNHIWVINNFIAYQSASYARDLTVHGMISSVTKVVCVLSYRYRLLLVFALDGLWMIVRISRGKHISMFVISFCQNESIQWNLIEYTSNTWICTFVVLFIVLSFMCPETPLTEIN